MNVLQHLKGNFLIGGTGVFLSFFGKKILNVEMLPVSSVKNIIFSFSGIVIATIGGKILMYQLGGKGILGFDKVATQGFIGPMTTDGFPFIPENPFKIKPWMGCKNSKQKINENSNVQRRLRIGIGLKKGEDGNYHFGLEAGYEKKKDQKISNPEKEISNPEQETPSEN